MKLRVLISVVCVLAASGSARTEPGFDAKEVVRQIHSRTDISGLRSGAVGHVPARGTSRVPFHPTAEERGGPIVGGELSLDHGEFLLDTNSTLVPAPGNQDNPVCAFDGSNFLVVWEDRRRGGSYSDIWGARVTPDGTVLDVSGFIISQGVYDQVWPAVVFDGANFLVVWQDERNFYHSDIYGARVTPGGAVLDPRGFAISQGADDQLCPALAFDGENFLVAWEDYRHNDTSDIYGARVTPQGTVLDPLGIVIAQAADGQYSPAVGFGGASFLVAWTDCRAGIYGIIGIYGARVTSQGAVLDPDGVAIQEAKSARGDPAVGSDGTNFLVVWQDFISGPTSGADIWGARVSQQGVILGRALIARGASSQVSPVLAFGGENFLVVWQAVDMYNSDIYGARVTPAGSVLDRDGIVISGADNFQFSPALGFDGSNFLAVWQDYRGGGGNTDIYGARVTPEGEVLDTQGFVIPQAARDQLTPALAFDGSNYLVVWEDHRDGYSDIYGARVTPGGGVLDPDGFAISQGKNWQYSPAAAFDGANYLVAWEDQRGGFYSDIYGARVTPGGEVLDPEGIVISQAAKEQYVPALGFDGTNYLVVWQDNRAGEHSDVWGARVTSGGEVLDPSGFAIFQADNDQWYPALGFDGENYLVVWQDFHDRHADLYGARVTSQGTVLDPQGFVVSEGVLDQATPVLAFDGTNFLVVWTDYRSGVYSDIFGARVTRQGTVLDPEGFGIWRAAQGQVGPALGLGFDGTNYLVVWEDYRSDQPDIFGAMVTPAGVVIDSGWVVKQEGNQLHPKLARGPGSDLFLVYQGWVGTLGGKLYNTDRIWGEMNPTITGVKESQPLVVYGSRPVATIVRGVLYLLSSSSTSSSSLLDAAGRRVMDLSAGANDVSKLAPGVYFIRGPKTEDGRPAVAVAKVVVTR